MAVEVERRFRYPLDAVLSRHSYENPMGGLPVYKSNIEIADEQIEKGFAAVSQAEAQFGEAESPLGVAAIFTHALEDSSFVLDAARRAIETHHPRLARFTETDKRFLLHLATNIRLGHLERHILDQEARSTYYPHLPDQLRDTLTRLQIAQIKALQADLSQG